LKAVTEERMVATEAAGVEEAGVGAEEDEGEVGAQKVAEKKRNLMLT